MKLKWRTVLTSVLIATGVGLLWAADLPGALGVDDVQAKQELVSALNSGNVPVGLVKAKFKAALPAERAQLVEGVLGWAKAYTESPAFAAAYAQARDHSKPAAPSEKGSVDEALKEQQQGLERQIDEMKKAAAAMPAEQRQAMEEAIKSVRDTMTQMATDPQMQQLQKQTVEARRAQQQQEYEASLITWQQNYPDDPRLLIARRLHAFLDACADVDFDAKLVPSGDKMRFAEQRYEQKPAEWKLCFRAGKKAVTAARTFATSWLAELERK
jgi:hypothetical protein